MLSHDERMKERSTSLYTRARRHLLRMNSLIYANLHRAHMFLLVMTASLVAGLVVGRCVYAISKGPDDGSLAIGWQLVLRPLFAFVCGGGSAVCVFMMAYAGRGAGLY